MAPKIPMFVLAHSSSAASLALQRGKISTLPSPQADATEEPDALAQVLSADPLQRNVDPKLLVSSKAKGPPQCRARPAKGDAPKKVACNKLGFLYLMASVCLCLQKTSSQPLELETVGDKRPFRIRSSQQEASSQASQAPQSSKRKKTT
jgi:hypothetical protein